MCFCKCVYVEFLDPKTRGLAQAKIQLAEMEMLPYAVCKTGLGVCIVCSLCMLKGQGKGCQDLSFVSVPPQNVAKMQVEFS